MRGFKPEASFGPTVAATYDDSLRGDEADAVDFFYRLAAGGDVLELAIGTGRIGLPLSQRGIKVDGIDLSADMLAVLKSKPGSEKIRLIQGDFEDPPVEGKYRLIYVVYNTFFNLLTQEEQVNCFQNVAEHLTQGGHFVIEALTPASLYRLTENQYVHAESVDLDAVQFDVGQWDPVSQTLDENHVRIGLDGITLMPIVTRYAWPSELDLMARIAGLELKERWQDWRRTPFSGSSQVAISVWGWPPN